MNQLVPYLDRELENLSRSVLRRGRALRGKKDSLSTKDLKNLAWARILRKVSEAKFENRQRFYAWVLTIMRNLYSDYWESVESKYNHEFVPLHEWQGDVRLRGASATVLHRVHIGEFQRSMEEMRRRDPELVQIVEYYYYLGLSQRKIAGILNITRWRVRTRLAAAERWLDRYLPISVASDERR